MPCIQQLTQEKRNRARRDCSGGEEIGGRGGRCFIVVNIHPARPELAEQNTMSRREAKPNFEYIGISMERLSYSSTLPYHPSDSVEPGENTLGRNFVII